MLGESFANHALDSVGYNDEISLRFGGHRLQLVGMKFVFEAEHHPQVATALLQNGQQMLSPNTAETVSPRTHGLTSKAHVDVIPAMDGCGNRGAALRICVAQIGDRLIGQHHAPAERIVGAIALEDRDLCLGVAPLHEQRGIEPARSTTHDNDVHCMCSGIGYTSTVPAITLNIK